MPVAAKNAYLLSYLSKKTNIEKIFEGELFIRTFFTTLLQIFFKFMFYSKVISKSMTGPDDTRRVSPHCLNGLKTGSESQVERTSKVSTALEGSLVFHLGEHNTHEVRVSFLLM